MSADQDILRFLRTRGPSVVKVMATELGLSQPTISRMIKAALSSVCVIGRGPSTTYAAYRAVRELHATQPLFVVTEAGECQSLGDLSAVHSKGFVFTQRDKKQRSLVFQGLPYFFADAVPQGFLGRSFSDLHPVLKLPARLQDWNDDDAWTALCRRGEDLPGNLIVGRESFERYQEAKSQKRNVITLKSRAKQYMRLAKTALESGEGGSSAAGEQPKFCYGHVLVKYSPPISTDVGRRWADLLVAEHIALEVLASKNYAASKSEIVVGDGRIFLEVQRFDRMGKEGRRGVLSLGAIEDQFFGRRDDWVAASLRLYSAKMISADDASRMRFMYEFGELIGNSDRHFGNLSFFWQPFLGKFSLTPAYDMLPMLDAPTEGQLVTREYRPRPPQADALSERTQARPLALEFWHRVATDERISRGYKQLAKSRVLQLNR